MDLRIRAETAGDEAAIQAVTEAAFETPAESRLVAALRENAHPIISLVADEGRGVVGHIMFSPVTLDGRSGLKIMGLAPMAVTPGRQHRGVGSALVRAGLEACREMGVGAVVVLGHPEYYPRFGFVPAERFGIGCQYDVPSEAFMVAELQAGYLQGVSGIVEYHAAFDEL